ncbi:MAG TPA: arsenical resistance operon transcriptional repressor ArsD [Clostridiaceae bacterium]|nr:arsenical resistance operon transcriptional repressor ArsD [Clostridiaceae bacterium]
MNQKELKIYEKALCCETGVCGPGVDPELLRITAVVRGLNKKGFGARRYNLSMHPLEFTKVPEITGLMQEEGMNVLPVTVLDGEIVKTGTYPTTQELSVWTGISSQDLEGSSDKVLTL